MTTDLFQNQGNTWQVLTSLRESFPWQRFIPREFARHQADLNSTSAAIGFFFNKNQSEILPLHLVKTEYALLSDCWKHQKHYKVSLKRRDLAGLKARFGTLFCRFANIWRDFQSPLHAQTQPTSGRYGSSFFPINLWSKCKEKRGSVTCSTSEETRLVRCLLHLYYTVCLPGSGKISIHMERLQISDGCRKQNESICR